MCAAMIIGLGILDCWGRANGAEPDDDVRVLWKVDISCIYWMRLCIPHGFLRSSGFRIWHWMALIPLDIPGSTCGSLLVIHMGGSLFMLPA